MKYKGLSKKKLRKRIGSMMKTIKHLKDINNGVVRDYNTTKRGASVAIDAHKKIIATLEDQQTDFFEIIKGHKIDIGNCVKAKEQIAEQLNKTNITARERIEEANKATAKYQEYYANACEELRQARKDIKRYEEDLDEAEMAALGVVNFVAGVIDEIR